MNSTKLTPQQLGDLKREFANLFIGDMSPRELFEFAIHRVTCDVAMMKQEELKDHIDEYDEYAYEILEDYVTDELVLMNYIKSSYRRDKTNELRFRTLLCSSNIFRG